MAAAVWLHTGHEQGQDRQELAVVLVWFLGPWVFGVMTPDICVSGAVSWTAKRTYSTRHAFSPCSLGKYAWA